MDSKGCLYPSSRDNLSTDLGCVLCISSSANFLHVHSTKHVWCVTMGQADLSPHRWVSWVLSDARITGAIVAPSGKRVLLK